MVNFDEVQRAQLAKSTLLTYTWGPLGSFKVCSDAKLRVECRKHLVIPSKTATLQWKTCLWAELQPWFPSLQWKTCPLGRIHWLLLLLLLLFKKTIILYLWLHLAFLCQFCKMSWWLSCNSYYSWTIAAFPDLMHWACVE